MANKRTTKILEDLARYFDESLQALALVGTSTSDEPISTIIEHLAADQIVELALGWWQGRTGQRPNMDSIHSIIQSRALPMKPSDQMAAMIHDSENKRQEESRPKSDGKAGAK